MRKITGIIVIVLGVISSGLFIDAGMLLKKTGWELVMLQSQNGNTISEAYYQSIGWYGLAYSGAAYAMACVVLMFGIGLGGLLIFQAEKKPIKNIDAKSE